MTWRRVFLIYGVLAMLVGYLTVFDGSDPDPTATDLTSPGPSLLGAEASAVSIVTFRKDGRTVRAELEAGRWRAVEPPGVHVPPDLIDAAIATLTAGQASEKLSEKPADGLGDYGLDMPSATIEIVVGAPTTPPIAVQIGARNPTQTAVYARRTDDDSIYLVGMNLRYYIDLIFEAATA